MSPCSETKAGADDVAMAGGEQEEDTGREEEEEEATQQEDVESTQPGQPAASGGEPEEDTGKEEEEEATQREDMESTQPGQPVASGGDCQTGTDGGGEEEGSCEFPPSKRRRLDEAPGEDAEEPEEKKEGDEENVGARPGTSVEVPGEDAEEPEGNKEGDEEKITPVEEQEGVEERELVPGPAQLEAQQDAELHGEWSCSDKSFDEKCRKVADALLDSDQRVTPARKFLGNLVTEVFQAPQERAVPFEEVVVGLLQSTLSEMRAKLEKEARDSQVDVDVAAADAVRCDARLADAESDLVTRRGIVLEKKASLAAENIALRVAAKELSDAYTAMEKDNQEIDEAAAKKEAIEVAEKTAYQPCKEGGLTTVKVKKHTKTLMALGQKYGFDESLLIGLPMALNKAPGERATFDTMVLNAFEAQMHTKMAEYDKVAAEGAPGKDARAASVEVVQKAHDAAKARQRSCAASFTRAQSAMVDAKSSVQAAKKVAKEHLPNLRRATAELDRVERRLAALQTGALAGFEELRHGCPPAAAVAALDDAPPPPSVEEMNTETAEPGAGGSDVEAQRRMAKETQEAARQDAEEPRAVHAVQDEAESTEKGEVEETGMP